MRFGIQIMNVEFQPLRDAAQAAEALGFDFLTLPDHIVYEGPERQSNAEHLAYDPIMQAAVAAEATKRLRVGHLVLCNLFRHPVFTAQAIASLDHLSGGRAFLGLGTGWTETEFKQTGIPYPDITTRLRMLDEALTAIRGLWTQQETTLDGEFYHLTNATLWPKPKQKPQPPILLGGSGKGLLRLAAKHADVVNIISEVGRAGYIKFSSIRAFGEDSFKEKAAFVRAEAARHGRDPKSIKLSATLFQVMLADSPAAARATAEQMSGMFGVGPDELRRLPMFLIGTPEECAAELNRRAKEWDISEVIFSYPGADVLRRLGEEVLPHVK
jgi:probable F420-dependent oxidoreductase